MAALAMGKYAWYVWPSYAVALGVIIVLAALGWRSYTTWRTRLAALEADEREPDKA